MTSFYIFKSDTKKNRENYCLVYKSVDLNINIPFQEKKNTERIVSSKYERKCYMCAYRFRNDDSL